VSMSASTRRGTKTSAFTMSLLALLAVTFLLDMQPMSRVAPQPKVRVRAGTSAT
jgi:hypothetical protein